ncbi:SDR family oxidoreductase [Christiangramia aquimixticola]|uniref:SDR family oxidoreductase n=1 Tax=Christiangramia aquimixticola TaxID=1697558 RepID=UPI003AA8905D
MRVLIAGASGALGIQLVKQLAKLKIDFKATTGSREGRKKLAPYANEIVVVNSQESPEDFTNVTRDIDIVISAIGKSISLFNPSSRSFHESDFVANKLLIKDALKNKVSRFIYVSMEGAMEANSFEIPGSHKETEDLLVNSGLNYSIIRPVGFFSGLNDLLIMAKRKVIPVIGSGDARTNSIYQGDLAKIIIDMLETGPRVQSVGGPEIHTRKEMAKMIQKKIGGKLLFIPSTLAGAGADMIKLLTSGTGNKLKYFNYIMDHDMIGERLGSMKFEEYLNTIDLKDLP